MGKKKLRLRRRPRPDGFPTRCRCGFQLIAEKVGAAVRFYGQATGLWIRPHPPGSSARCPGCGRPLDGLELEEIQEQTGRVPGGS